MAEYSRDAPAKRLRASNDGASRRSGVVEPLVPDPDTRINFPFDGSLGDVERYINDSFLMGHAVSMSRQKFVLQNWDLVRPELRSAVVNWDNELFGIGAMALALITPRRGNLSSETDKILCNVVRDVIISDPGAFPFNLYPHLLAHAGDGSKEYVDYKCRLLSAAMARLKMDIDEHSWPEDFVPPDLERYLYRICEIEWRDMYFASSDLKDIQLIRYARAVHSYESLSPLLDEILTDRVGELFIEDDVALQPNRALFSTNDYYIWASKNLTSEQLGPGKYTTAGGN
ncbi:MAG: hypothetical protein VW491_01310 [Gammaproteobacteria bacterium]